MKNEICIGMAGAGRATELHINALKRFTGIPLRFKMIVARRKEQLEVAKAIYMDLKKPPMILRTC